MTTYTITVEQREQLLDAFDSVAGKGKRCDAAEKLLQSLQPNTQRPVDFDVWQENPYTKVLMKSIKDDYVPKHNTQEPVAYVSRIAANGRADINWLQGVNVGDKLFTHPAPQQPAEVAALQAKVNAAEARERQTRATLHKYMANQQQAEPVSHEL